MRVPILLASSLSLLLPAHAVPLSDADRETLLGNLEKIRETADSKVDARFRIAIAAYRAAVSSDEATIALYLNCINKINFEDQQKKPAEFREWRHKEAEKLADPGLHLALRHQLRWLILTLQASSENADRPKLSLEAQEIVDAIFRDAASLKNHEQILSQAVTSTLFAKAYDITGVEVENWPLSPIQLDALYEQILLPPFRRPAQIAALRTAWVKRIQQEGAKVQFWKGNYHEEKKGAILVAPPSQEYEKFLEITQPQLQWQMEVDLFQNGDESAAAVRMLAHLEKYIAHPAVREWSDQFKLLLKPVAPTVPKT